MHYQPIVDAHTGAVESVEALVRWTCPKHGAVPPDVFVAIAEETGLMADLGKFVIEQAVEDSTRWPHIKTAINISPAQLRSSSIVQDLLKPTRAHNVLPSQIIIEITESMLLSNDVRTIRTLNILKDHGFSIALDDFGTGYSSLAYIRDFPFDKLKIDRSFVTGQGLSERSIDIIKAVVNFGRILGREVVAEGIETEQEMQAMQSAGVTHLQGYLFSKPLPAAHIEALIATSGRLTAARTIDRAPAEVSKIDRSFATKLRNIA
jgi:EAL domain-containing protein (putative c-di-GMP-specific phosphodiesterase class I)